MIAFTKQSRAERQVQTMVGMGLIGLVAADTTTGRNGFGEMTLEDVRRCGNEDGLAMCIRREAEDLRRQTMEKCRGWLIPKPKGA